MTPDEELAADRDFERRLLWKGVLALVLVIAVVVVRALYFV